MFDEIILIVLIIILIYVVYKTFVYSPKINIQNEERFEQEIITKIPEEIKALNIDNIINDNDKLNHMIEIMENRYLRNNILKEKFNKNLSDTQIFIINLPKSESRLRNIFRQKAFYDIKNLNVFEAVNGLSIKNKYNDSIQHRNNIIHFKTNDYKANEKEIGCTLSHLILIHDFYRKYKTHMKIMSEKQMRNTFILICEDDVSFMLVPFWENTLREITQKANENWEYINLSGLCENDFKNDFLKVTDNNCYGASSYIINLHGAKKIIDKLYDKDNNLYNLVALNNYDRQLIIADVLLPDICNSYMYRETLFVPINNHKDMNSTIHPENTDFHINYTIGKIRPYYDKMVKKNENN